MEAFQAALNDPETPKDKTIGIAVSEEMHTFYTELRASEEVDIDVTNSVRGHLENLSRRRPEVFERAMRKLDIERRY